MSKVGKDCKYNRKAIANAQKNGKKKRSMETLWKPQNVSFPLQFPRTHKCTSNLAIDKVNRNKYP
jgi:hypothetical protein